MSEDASPSAEPLKFTCTVDGHRVTLHQIGASGSGWRCTCRDFSRSREGDPPSCGHIELAFDVWYRHPNPKPERIKDEKWY